MWMAARLEGSTGCYSVSSETGAEAGRWGAAVRWLNTKWGIILALKVNGRPLCLECFVDVFAG